MDNGIRIGNELSKESTQHIKELIETTFRVGAETRMEQETIKEALRLIGNVAEIKNISITDSNIRGDNHVHLAEED